MFLARIDKKATKVAVLSQIGLVEFEHMAIMGCHCFSVGLNSFPLQNKLSGLENVTGASINLAVE